MAENTAKFEKFDKMSARMVAKWMVQQLADQRSLYQEGLAKQIRDRFGEGFVYQTARGDLAINNLVLRAFGELNGNNVVWERANLRWTYREPFHRPGRMQD